MSEPVVLNLPPPASAGYRAAAGIVRTLRRAGHQAYIVGGAVRDLVAGKEPKDFDVASSARPEQVMGLFERAIPVGASFGVVAVVREKMNFEVATFREECGSLDGRRPETLRFSHTPAEDVSRRDFTVNALLYDPETHQVLDLVGGLDDLRRGVLRTIGDPRKRFAEDYLRMLRAVRFAVRFQLNMEAQTAAAIRELAEKLRLLSAERVRDELTLLLCGPSPDRAYRALSRLGMLRAVLPEIEAMHGVEQPAKYHPEGDVFEHTMRLLQHIAYPSPALGWAALLHDVGKPGCRTVKAGVAHFYGHETAGALLAETIMRRLKQPAALIAQVTAAVRSHMRFSAVKCMRPATWRRLIAGPGFPLELELHRLDCLACHARMDNYVFLLDRLAELRQTGKEALPAPLVTGRDLIRAGIAPGPALGAMLRRLRDLQLDGKLKTRSRALQMVKNPLAAAKLAAWGQNRGTVSGHGAMREDGGAAG